MYSMFLIKKSLLLCSCVWVKYCSTNWFKVFEKVFKVLVIINPFSANHTKWLNTLKQLLPTNCLSVFDHFVGLAITGLNEGRIPILHSTFLQYKGPGILMNSSLRKINHYTRKRNWLIKCIYNKFHYSILEGFC